MAAQRSHPKTMSSRLAGMKFMQRSAPGSPATPSTPSEPPSKRQRLVDDSGLRSPATPVDTPDSLKRATPAEKASANKEDSQWYLSYKPAQRFVTESPLRIVSAGFASLDAAGRHEVQDGESAEDHEDYQLPVTAGRKRFGNFKKAVPKQQDSQESGSQGYDHDEHSAENEDEGETEIDPTGVKALLAQGRKDATERARAERMAKKQEDTEASAKLAAQRRSKGIDLNRVKSISVGGGTKKKGHDTHKEMECYKCGEKGHPKFRCPN